MRHIFPYGDVADNFESNSIPFVKASGGSSAKIALLLTGGPEWKKHVPLYSDHWRHQGVKEVVPIVPLKNSEELGAEAVSRLSSCSGIFIGGGDTRKYHKIYTNTEVANIIRELYQSGVPFGGVSAGALISTERCTIWGGKVISPINEYFIKAKSYVDPAKDGDVQLTIGAGLRLLKDCIVEVHFSEVGGFPRLVQAMELTESTYGLGIDEPICLEIQDETIIKVHGRGRAYILRRLGFLRFETRVLEPGDELKVI